MNLSLIKKKYYLLLFFPVLLFIAYLVFRKPNLKTASPKMGTVIEAVYGLGTVTANRTFDLKIGVSAVIAETFVKEGDFVKQGEPLLKLMDIPTFKAPFDGVVTYFPYSTSEVVFPQMLILTLTDLTHLHLVVSLEQEGALRVRAGQNVRFSFESLTGKKFTGKVKSIFPNRNQFFVKIEPDELPPEILPGMTADVAIEVAKKENVLLIPVVSIYNGKVMRIREGKKSKIDVQIGNLDGEWAEVINSDLGVNDEIVIPEKTTK